MYKRYILFLGVCIMIRLSLVFLAKFINKKYLPYLGYLALIPAIGFLNIYFFSPRETGPEVFGDKIWWNELRIVHAALYLLFANYAIKKKSYSYIPLAIEVTIGLISFLIKHFY